MLDKVCVSCAFIQMPEFGNPFRLAGLEGIVHSSLDCALFDFSYFYLSSAGSSTGPGPTAGSGSGPVPGPVPVP